MAAHPPAEAAGYTVDLVYPSSFVLAQTPLQLQWGAVVNGASPGPLTGQFNYCDLGCGDGSTLCLLAACYPQATFFGVDVNEAHIALGRARAARASLSNVRFIQASFADIASRGLPPFDYIAAFGIYSWLVPEQQTAIDAFAGVGLKPTGLFAVHYSSLPGSAVHDPLSHYIRACGAGGGSSDRYGTGLAAVRKLLPIAQFFRSHPQAIELLKSVERHPPDVVAHDVLNRRTHSFYCTEVHERLAAREIEYLGSANILPDCPELMLSSGAFAAYHDVIKGADTPFRELIRDLMLDSAQRFDLFRRAGAELEAKGNRLRALGDLYLQRAGTAQDIETRRRLSSHSAVNLASTTYTAILDLAGAHAITLGDMLASVELRAYPPAEIERAIEHLFALGLLNVLVARPIEARYRDDHRYRLRSALNAERLRETLTSPAEQGLASHVLGSPLILSAAARLRLMTLLGGDIAPIWEISGGAAIGTLAQFRQQVEAGMPSFVAHAVPRLLQLGILEEDS